MAEKQMTPICEATGLPLPILPTEPEAARFSFWDYHHHFHPRNSIELNGVDGKALRYSRGQLLPREIHNQYHRIFEGPELPQVVDEKFRLTVLACAGVVPRKAIVLQGANEYEEIDLDDREYRQLSAPQSIYIEREHKPRNRHFTRNAIGKFFANYAIKQNIAEVVSEHVIDQFLNDATDELRKKELGNFILKEALGVSIAEIEKEHRELTKEGYVAPSRRTAPRELMRKFFTKDHYPDYHEEVARRVSLVA